MSARDARERFHRGRLIFWALQVPPVAWASMKWPDAPWLFTYLVVISQAALIESALTDYDQARNERKKAQQ